MGGSPPKVQAQDVDIRGSIRDYVRGLSGVLPMIAQQEARFRPEFQRLNLQDVQSFLYGGQGQQGLMGLQSRAARQTRDLLQRERRQELRDLRQASGGFRRFADVLSPEAAAQVGTAAEMAAEARMREQQMGITPGEQRDIEQRARESAAARGMTGSTGSLATEVLNRDIYQQQKGAALRAEATQAGRNAFELGQSFYTAPGMAYLTGAPKSFGVGSGMLNLGLGAIGAGLPQLFQPGQGLNIAGINAQNQLAAQSANAQSQAAYQQGIMGMIGSGVGAAASIAAAPMTGGTSLLGLALGR